MKTCLVAVFVLGLVGNLYAHDLPIRYGKKITSTQKEILEKTFTEVSSLMPTKLKEGLPQNIEIKIEKLSEIQNMPGDEICHAEKIEKSDSKKPFVYGVYDHFSNTLKLNIPVLAELNKGKNNSTKISCQHGSLYGQSIATIIHELTHAFDLNQNNLSSSVEFLHHAGFKKGLLKIKNKNVGAMRSADPYELVNSKEAFAVNMEYFVMDSEYACRKPALFNYYKKLLEVDPYPTRTCEMNHTVMMSSSQGYTPVKLDLDRVYRIDYLMASPGSDLSSGFGHSMFRIVLCAPEHYDVISKKTFPATPFGPKCLDDKLYHVVVSYRANVEDATLNYYKGIFGGYPSTLFILNFAEVLDEYNKDELRDVMAYPLKLTEVEKNEFIARVIEEHWNYRGDYKFFTRNCATESQDLLKFSLDRSDLDSKSSYTPKGVLEDLDKLQFSEMKGNTVETYKAKTDQLVSALKSAYNQSAKTPDKSKALVLKFIKTSDSKDRLSGFHKVETLEKVNVDSHAELSIYRDKLIQLSSFSVLEQQILRTIGSGVRKQAVDLLLNSKDERVINMLNEDEQKLKIDFKDFSKSGYGIPLADEMLSSDEVSSKLSGSKDAGAEFEKLARDLMPDGFKMLDDITANISTFNDASIKMRKNYREKLELYIHQVIHNLTLDETTKSLLYDIQNGKTSRIKELRDLLDPSLVNEREILDVKLAKYVSDELAR